MVRVPAPAEVVRDLCRAHGDLVADRHRARQRRQAFLLRPRPGVPRRPGSSSRDRLRKTVATTIRARFDPIVIHPDRDGTVLDLNSAFQDWPADKQADV